MDLYYDGPNEAAAGVSSFADNFLKTYLALKESGQRQKQADYQGLMTQRAQEEMAREAKLREVMAEATRPQPGMMELPQTAQPKGAQFQVNPALAQMPAMVTPKVSPDELYMKAAPYLEPQQLLTGLGQITRSEDAAERNQRILEAIGLHSFYKKGENEQKHGYATEENQQKSDLKKGEMGTRHDYRTAEIGQQGEESR